jgi:hypothetical protein
MNGQIPDETSTGWGIISLVLFIQSSNMIKRLSYQASKVSGKRHTGLEVVG